MSFSKLVTLYTKGIVTTLMIAFVLVCGQGVYAAGGGDPAVDDTTGSAGGSVPDLVSSGSTSNIESAFNIGFGLLRVLSGDPTGAASVISGVRGGGSGGGGDTKDVNVQTSKPDAQKAAADAKEAAKNSALYKTIMGLIRSFTAKMVSDTYDFIQKGFAGESPAFYTEPWNQWMSNTFSSAGGYFVEGVIDGIMTNQKEEAYTEKTSSDLQKFNADLSTCQTEAQQLNDDCDGGDKNACSLYHKKLDECQAINTKAQNLQQQANLFFEQQQQHRDIARLDAQGAISPEAQQFMDSIVCRPSASLTLKIGLGLLPSTGTLTHPPVCKLTEAFSNWSNLIQRTGTGSGGNQWGTLADFFDPNSTELGISFNAQVAQFDYQQRVTQEEIYNRLTQTPFKNVADTVSKSIKTPGAIVGNLFSKAFEESAKPNQLTGNPVVDGLSIVFESATDTLYGKLVDSLKKGITTAKPWSLYGGDFFTFTGVPAAQRNVTRFSSTVKVTQKDNLDITNRLLSTDSAGNPDANTIGSGMALVLQNGGMTLRDAIAKGHIKPTAVFGYDLTNKEPRAKDGDLPYTSLVILRKYRVIPVSWEFAALYIHNQGGKACNDRPCTIQDMVDSFDKTDSPFHGLVDPNWVLKLPPVRCNLWGYGPTNILKNTAKECIYDTNGDGVIDCSGNIKTGTNNSAFDIPVPNVSRDQTCVDDQSCLQTDSEGNCVQGRYGYCVQEMQTWNFKAEQCEQQYNTCRALTNSETGQSLSALTSSLQGAGVCSAESVGCHWVSNARITTDTTRAWDSAKKLYLNAKANAIACDQSGEGCEAVTNTTRASTTTEYYKLAPNALKCGVGQENYGKTQCEPFVTQCSINDVGCNLYTSLDGQSSIAGKNPRSCNASCVGLGLYTQVATPFDPAVANVPFIAEKAQQCSAQDVGCEEFTNLSNETKVYFKDVQSCEKTPAAPTPFYTWYGSDTTGFRLAVVNIKADNPGTPQETPKCGIDPQTNTPYQCECGKAEFEAQRSNPLSAGFSCREYINKAGNVSYRYATKVMYQTDDCTQMRASTSGAAYTFSPSRSASCTPQAAGCRLYQGTQAGNSAAVLVSDFEDGTKGGWTGVGVSPSTENPVRNGKSIKVVGGGTTNVSHTVTLHDGYTYTATFEIQNTSGGDVYAAFGYDNPATALPMGKITLNTSGDWQLVTFSLPTIHFTSSEKEALFTITTPSGTSYIDNVVVREGKGIIYAIKDKLNVPNSCQTAISPAGADEQTRLAALGSQLNCRLYTDTLGNQQTLSGVAESCPLTAVGCNKFHVTPVTDSAYDTYFVPTADKQCDSSERSCKAYGLPTLDASGYVAKKTIKDANGHITLGNELWNTVYYKYTTDTNDTKSKAAMCTSEQDQCQAYKDANGTVFGYYKDPGANVCTWIAATKDQPARWVQKDNPAQACDPHAAKLCPETEDYCRAITDPECVNGSLRTNYGNGLNGSGNACTSTYYIKENTTTLRDASKECKGIVDPSVGCLLFNDPLITDPSTKQTVNTYDSVSSYAEYGTTKKGVNVNTQIGVNKDANAVYKVDLDRQCKIWLACTSSVRVSDDGSGNGPQDICLQRRPCNKWGDAGEPCAQDGYVNDADPTQPINPLLFGSFKNDIGGTAIVRSLSGVARPNFTFSEHVSQAYSILGGHDSTFGWSQTLDTTDPAKDNRSTSRLDNTIMNSCRLYPQDSAPLAWSGNASQYWDYIDENGSHVTPAIPIDACSYKDQNLDRQQGLYGYCLEPYPQYGATTPQNDQYSATKNAAAGYQNYCLNWYPVGYISGQSNVLGGDHPIPAYQGAKPLYYCVQSAGGKQGFDSQWPASTEPKTEYAVKTRDTSVFRFDYFGTKLLHLRDTKSAINTTQSSIPAVSSVSVKVVDTMTEKDGIVVPTFGSLQSMSTYSGFPSSQDVVYTPEGKATITFTFASGTMGNQKPTCSITRDTEARLFNNHHITILGLTLTSLQSSEVEDTAKMELRMAYNSDGSARVTFEDYIDLNCSIGGTALSGAKNIRIYGVDASQTAKGSAADNADVAMSDIVGNTTSTSVDASQARVGMLTIGLPKRNFEGSNSYRTGILKIEISDIPDNIPVECKIPDNTKDRTGSLNLHSLYNISWNGDTIGVPNTTQLQSLGLQNDYIGKDWNGNYTTFSATSQNGRVRFNLVAQVEDQYVSAQNKELSMGQYIPLDCTIGGGARHETFNVKVRGLNTSAQLPYRIYSSISSGLKNVLSSLSYSVNSTKDTIITSSQHILYRIAGLNPSSGTSYEVIKPAFTLSGTADFTFNEGLADTAKTITVKPNPIPRRNVDQFAWRAVVDTSKTPHIGVQGGYLSSWFFVVPGTEHGETDGTTDASLQIKVRKEIISSLSAGTYQGAVKVYMVAPIEGMKGGITEQTLPVTLTIPKNRFTQGADTLQGVPLESPPDASSIQDTFSAAVSYLNLDTTLNADRMKGDKLRDATSPLYAPNTMIDVHLDGNNGHPILCSGSSPIQARLIYSYTGEGAWHAVPDASFTVTGDIKRNFTVGECDKIHFTVNSGTGTGLQYYFVVETPNNTSVRSEVFYVDVNNLTGLSGNPTDAQKIADQFNPIGDQLRDSKFGIVDTAYVAHNLMEGALKLSSLVTKTERLLAYKNYNYSYSHCDSSSGSKGGYSETCYATASKSVHDYSIDDVTSSNTTTANEYVPYCGENKPCEKIEWLAPKEEAGKTDGPRTRLQTSSTTATSDPILTPGQGTGTNPVYIHTETRDPGVVNNKFLSTDTQYTKQPYQGNVAVRVKTSYSYQYNSTSSTSCPAEGACSSSFSSRTTECTLDKCVITRCGISQCNDETTDSNLNPDGSVQNVSSTLVVRPEIVLPDTVTLTTSHASKAYPLLIDSNPKETIYHWRAQIDSIDPIRRRDNGQFNWLSVSPTAGMSGTSISLAVTPEAAAFAVPGTKYTAKLKVYATSPVTGSVSKTVNVVFQIPAAQPKVTITAISSSGQYTAPSAPMVNFNNLDDSIMVLYEDGADTRRPVFANEFEKKINRDQIAQINYTIEHRTRQTLPGINWSSTDIQSLGENLVCTKYLSNFADIFTKFMPDVLIGGFKAAYNNISGCSAGPEADKDPSGVMSDTVNTNYDTWYKALANATRPVISTTDKTNMYTMVLNSANTQDVTPQNAFSAQCHGRKDGDIGRDFAAIQPEFDKNGNIASWRTRYCDDSGGSFLGINTEGAPKYIFVTITIYLKDYCSEVVQVVKDDGTAIPQRQTVLDAKKDAAGAPLIGTDTIPMMSLIPPTGRPDKWSQPIPIINDNSTSIAHAQAISVDQNTRKAVSAICLGGPKTGKQCTTNNNCTGGGQCFGSTANPMSETTAFTFLQKYFAGAYSTWKWDFASHKYVKQANGANAYTPDALTKTNPVINYIGIDGTKHDGIYAVVHPDGKTVEIFFNTTIAANQKPLSEISVNWGDQRGTQQTLRYSDDDRPIEGTAGSYTKPRGEHHFTHAYADTARNKTITVTVKDNWGSTTTTEPINLP